MRFRRLTDDDLPMLHEWLNEPGVVRWWEGDDVSWEGVVAQYGSDRDDPTEHWLAFDDDVPIGWIQCYAWADYPRRKRRKRSGGPASIARRRGSTTSWPIRRGGVTAPVR